MPLIKGRRCFFPKRLLGFARSFSARSFLLLSIVVILALGISVSLAEINRGKKEFSRRLLRQARFLESGLNKKELSTLNGNIDDMSKPEYSRLRKQLANTSEIFPNFQSVYLMRIDDEGNMVFLVDSAIAGSEDESLPGDLYEDKDLLMVLETGRGAVMPLMSDKWGTWITVAIPIIDPYSDEVFAVLGVDIDSKDWGGFILSYAVLPIIFSFTLIFIAIISYFMVRWRERLPSEKLEKRFSRYLESLIFLAVGVTVTVFASFLVNEQQKELRNSAFITLAESRAHYLTEKILSLRDHELEGLSRFFESSIAVEREEFRNYTQSLTSNGLMNTWFWVERIKVSESLSLEPKSGQSEFEQFSIWSFGDQDVDTFDSSEEFLYPIKYVEPFEEYGTLAGLDLGSNLLIRAAIDEALSYGLITATDPLIIPNHDGSGPHFFVFKPVFGNSEDFVGFVGALVHPESFVKTLPVLDSEEDPTVILGLYQILEDGSPYLLFSMGHNYGFSINPSAHSSLWHYDVSGLNLVVPVFVFGRVFAVVAHPGPDFSTVYPLDNWIFILAIGLTLTFSLSILVGYLTNRSFHLEREVGKRTEELRESLEIVSKTMEASVNVLASAVDLRDPYTSGHQRRVAELSFAIGKKLRLEEDRIRGLRLSAMIHDVGKIQVPAEILSTPRRLTDLEFDLIKLHPTAGHELFKDIEFPWPVADAIYQHHERLDGSGYPEGISGEKIILEARIIAVADVVEAISSHRPYRPSLGIDVALDEIRKGKGRLFDPEVVDACLELFDEGFSFSD
ncbi:MAG: CHASE domain-containing protein [Kosmotogaceae bacterium]|nr:CHASE domain-containing protein [Kosmotogaceae bacterium]